MTIRTGSSGKTVREVQEMLNTVIPVQPLLNLDGMFGPKTNQRVVAFQTQSSLMADGVVGPMTSKALVGAVLQKLKTGF